MNKKTCLICLVVFLAFVAFFLGYKIGANRQIKENDTLLPISIDNSMDRLNSKQTPLPSDSVDETISGFFNTSTKPEEFENTAIPVPFESPTKTLDPMIKSVLYGTNKPKSKYADTFITASAGEYVQKWQWESEWDSCSVKYDCYQSLSPIEMYILENGGKTDYTSLLLGSEETLIITSGDELYLSFYLLHGASYGVLDFAIEIVNDCSTDNPFAYVDVSHNIEIIEHGVLHSPDWAANRIWTTSDFEVTEVRLKIDINSVFELMRAQGINNTQDLSVCALESFRLNDTVVESVIAKVLKKLPIIFSIDKLI